MTRRFHAPAIVSSVLFLALARPGAEPPALRYTFAVAPGDSAALTVEMRIEESAPGPIRLELPSEWAGQTELYHTIVNLRAATPGDQLIDTDTAWVKILNHAGGATAVLRYELRQDWTGPIQSPSYHRAIVQRDWALLVGQNSLVLPQDRPTAPRGIALDFGFLPPGWVVGTSYGTGRPHLEFRASADELRDAEIALGNWRSRSVRVGGKPIYVLQHGQQRFTEAGFDSVLKSIVETERSFWHATAPAEYLVTLMPTRRGEHGGTRLTGAFMVAIDSTAELNQGTTRLLAHELFHEWNGGGTTLHAAPGPEERLKWFTEGFTDFYAWELAHRSKAISDSVYADGINGLLHERGMSTWTDSTSAALDREFWHDNNAKLEAYHRGNVVALRADRALRDASHGRKSMDNVMRRLAADSSHAALTDSIIAAALILEGAPDGTRWIAQMRAAEPIPIGPDLLGKCFAGESYRTARFDLGFDFPASRTAMSVRGVDPRSAGYAAGLRDSMPVLGFSFNNGDPSRNAVITVTAPDGGRRAITYAPVSSDSVTLLRFAPRRGC